MIRLSLNSQFTLIFALLFTLQFESLFAQVEDGKWVMQNPIPTGENLSDVHFEDKNTGWAEGDIGTILQTSDGGDTWNILNSGTQRILRSVHFINKNTGWFVGDMGKIVHTTNGGGIY